MTTSEMQQAERREMEPRAKQPAEREGLRPGQVFRPDVDVLERPEEFLVVADLPGVGEDNVRVDLEKGVLRIDASPSVVPGEEWRPVYGEYRLGGYHREFAMGEAIDVDGITARMSDGVLEIRLPKSERHRPRRIPIGGA